MLVSRNGSGRELAWTIWGDEAEVAERLREAGATIRQIEPLTLEEAALVLLARHAPSDGPKGSGTLQTISAGV